MPEPLDAAALHRLLQSGTEWLARNAAVVNALNVFPVPDGDTGTNMLLTMRAALEAMAKANTDSVGALMRAAAQGAVMGARGNSGVILSQIIAGMARGLQGLETCDGPALARALAEGANTAYRAVTRPVEGTILTVARATGERALATVADDAPAGRDVLALAADEAKAAVERTPEQMELLRQAGVVDAGGEGYRVILEGMALAARGEPLPVTKEASVAGAAGATGATAACESVPPGVPARVPLVHADALPVEEWGYCTQFVIRGDALDVERLRRELQDIAESALVVGDETLVRVHGHADDPGQLLSHAVKYGRLQRISIEDMDAQHDEWLRTQAGAATAAPDQEDRGEAPRERTGIATVAVAPGAGFGGVLESLGAGQIVHGGQTMNPSAFELVEAAKRTQAWTVLVLPNNGNVVMTAQQAVALAESDGVRLVVVPTKTVPQGIAAQLAFSPDLAPEENAQRMAEAAAAVRTVELTRAVRAAKVGGIDVGAGDVLGLVDDRLVVAGGDMCDVACRALEQASAAQAEVIAVYFGDGVHPEEAKGFAAVLRRAYPRAEVELIPGGQPHYDYVISVE
ncbi:MAG: DAK2 domain-containing protein [Chloroflexi bacterium]|nr:DAK2 domain-containing protein [Chloroflexota bacterium]